MGHMQGTAAQIGPVAFALGAGSRNMAERIGARIAKLGSVFGAAAANRIENEEERAGQCMGLLVQSCASHGLDSNAAAKSARV